MYIENENDGKVLGDDVEIQSMNNYCNYYDSKRTNADA